MDTLASLNAEISDWRRAYNQTKEQYDGLLEVHRTIKDKLRAEQTACAKAQNNDRIAMAWIADIKAAVGCEHMDMPHKYKPVRCNQEYQKMRSKWLAYHPT